MRSVRIALLFLFAAGAGSACNAITGASDIEYTVTGTAGTRVSLTYESGSGTSQVSSATVPWSYSFKAEKDGFLYVSAQILSSTGSITATIRKNGKDFKTGTASGFAAIATASGSNN